MKFTQIIAAIVVLCAALSAVDARGALFVENIRPVPPATATHVTKLAVIGDATSGGLTGTILASDSEEGFGVTSSEGPFVAEATNNVNIVTNLLAQIGQDDSSDTTSIKSTTTNDVVMQSRRFDLDSPNGTVSVSTRSSSFDLIAKNDLLVSAGNATVTSSDSWTIDSTTGAVSITAERGALIQSTSNTFVSLQDIQLVSPSGSVTVSGTSDATISANRIDISGRAGVDVVSAGSIALSALSVVDLDGGLVDIDISQTGSIRATKSVVVQATSFVVLDGKTQNTINAPEGTLLSADGDSESHILIDAPVGGTTMSGSGDAVIRTVTKDSSVDFISAGSLNINTREISLKASSSYKIQTSGDVDVKSANNMTLKTNDNDIFVIAETLIQLDAKTKGDVQILAAKDIQIDASLMNVLSALAIDAQAADDFVLEARDRVGTLSLTTSANPGGKIAFEATDRVTFNVGTLTIKPTQTATLDGQGGVDITSGIGDNIIISSNTDIIAQSGQDTIIDTDIFSLEAVDEFLLTVADSIKVDSNAGRPFAIVATADSIYTADKDITVKTLQQGDINYDVKATHDSASTTLTIDAAQDGTLDGGPIVLINKNWIINAGENFNMFSLGTTTLQAATKLSATFTKEFSSHAFDQKLVATGDLTIQKSGLQTWTNDVRVLIQSVNDAVNIASTQDVILNSGDDVSINSAKNNVLAEVNLRVHGSETTTIQTPSKITFTQTNAGDGIDINALENFLWQGEAGVTWTSKLQTSAVATHEYHATVKEDALLKVENGDLNLLGGAVEIDARDGTLTWNPTNGQWDVLAASDKALVFLDAFADLKMITAETHQLIATRNVLVQSAEGKDVQLLANTKVDFQASGANDRQINTVSQDFLIQANKDITVTTDFTVLNSTGTTNLEGGDDSKQQAKEQVFVNSETMSYIATNDLTIDNKRWQVIGTKRVNEQSASMTITSADNKDITFVSGGQLSISTKQAGNKIETTKDFMKVISDRHIQGTFAAKMTTTVQDGSVEVRADDGIVEISGGSVELEATAELMDVTSSGDFRIEAQGTATFLSKGSKATVNTVANIGLSIRTKDPSGDIFFDSQLGSTNFFAADTLTVSSQDESQFYTKGTTTVQAQTDLSLKANQFIDIDAHDGFAFNAKTIDTNADGSISLLSRDSILIEGQSQVTDNPSIVFTATKGHILMVTGTGKDISLVNTAAIAATATKDVTVHAGEDFTINGESVAMTLASTVTFSTIGGPIKGTSTGPVSVQSIDDSVILTSGGSFNTIAVAKHLTQAALDISVSADQSITMSTDTIDKLLTYTAGTGGLRITSAGDRTSPRDGVTFTAVKDVLVETEATFGVNINAVNDVYFGKEERPVVSIVAGGGSTVSGVELVSSGDIDVSHNEATYAALKRFDIEGTTSVDIATDGKFVITSTGDGTGSKDLNVISHIGSLHVIGGSLEFESLTKDVRLTSTVDGIFIESDGEQVNDGIKMEATTGDVLVRAGNLDADTATFISVATQNSLWRAHTTIALSTDADDGGSISFTSAKDLHVLSDGAMVLRTTLDDADIVLRTLKLTEDIVITTKGTSGSPLNFVAGNNIHLLAKAVQFSGNRGVYVEADNIFGDDSKGDLEFIIGTAATWNAGQTVEVFGGDQTLIRSTKGSVALQATLKNVEIEAGDDITFVAGTTMSSTTAAVADLHTAVDQGGDIKFIGQQATITSAGAAKIETGGNFLGFIADGALQAAKRALLNAEGSGASLELRATRSPIVGTGAGDLKLIAGSTPANVASDIVIEAGRQGNLQSTAADITFTAQTSGNIVHRALHGDVRFNSVASDLSAAQSINFVADGVDRDVRYAMKVQSTAGPVTLQAVHNTISFDGHQGIDVSSGKDMTFLANRPAGTAVQGSNFNGIQFNALGRDSALEVDSQRDQLHSSTQQIRIEARDTNGGDVAFVSAGSVSMKAFKNINLFSEDPTGSINVAIDAAQGNTADILLYSQDYTRIQGSRRVSVEATSTKGADVRIHSDTSKISFRQTVDSESDVGIELRAVEGDVDILTLGEGDVNVQGQRKLYVDGAAGVRMFSSPEDTGTPSIEIRGADFRAHSLNGNVEMIGADGIAIRGGRTIFKTIIKGDIRVDAHGEVGINVGGDLALRSERGDILLHTDEGNLKVISLDKHINIDGDAFVIPFENEEIEQGAACQLKGQYQYFTDTSTVFHVIDSQANPQDPTSAENTRPYRKNFGSLCHCLQSNKWACAYM